MGISHTQLIEKETNTYLEFNLAVPKILMLIFFESTILFLEIYVIKILVQVHTHPHTKNVHKDNLT